MGWSSIRIRLTLWNGAIVAVLMIAFGLVLCLRVQRELSRSIDADLATTAGPLRVTPPVFPPPFLDPEHGIVNAGSSPAPLPAPISGIVFGAAENKVKVIVPPDGRLASDSKPQTGRAIEVAIRGIADEASEPAHQAVVVKHTRLLADDGVTPLPRFFALATEPVSDVVTPNKLEAWDPVARAAATGGREQYSTVTRAGTRMRVLSVPMRQDGKVVGVIQVAHSLTDQDRLTALQASTISIFVPLSVLVSAITGALLTGRALRPVRSLTQAADEIEAGDLSRRLEVRGNDEFSNLSRTFNRMIARLGGAFQELQRGYHRIEDAYSRLQVAYEHERRFTSDASHELSTPLTRIKACSSLALSTKRSAASYRASLEFIDRCTDTMTKVVGDLLLLARGDAAQIGLRMEALPAAEVARQAVNRLAPESGTRIQVHDPRKVEVQADREYLTRVLVNLLENAVRHTPADGSVVVEIGEQNAEVVLAVADTGEGIAPEHLPHVFERFYRVDAGRDRDRGGTGLGLAICQSIVSAHGGSLEVDSEVGRGTRVTVRLPRPPGEAPTTHPQGGEAVAFR